MPYSFCILPNNLAHGMPLLTGERPLDCLGARHRLRCWNTIEVSRKDSAPVLVQT